MHTFRNFYHNRNFTNQTGLLCFKMPFAFRSILEVLYNNYFGQRLASFILSLPALSYDTSVKISDAGRGGGMDRGVRNVRQSFLHEI